VAARGGVYICTGTAQCLFKSQFKFAGHVVRQGEGRSNPRRLGVGYRPEVSVRGVVRDISFCTEREVDWFTLDDSLDIKAADKYVVNDELNGPCAIDVLLWLECVVFAESGFCTIIVGNVGSSVSMCEFR